MFAIVVTKNEKFISLKTFVFLTPRVAEARVVLAKHKAGYGANEKKNNITAVNPIGLTNDARLAKQRPPT